MAQIPVAEIPGLQPLPQPVMTEYPSKRVNYSNEAAALQQSQISPDAFLAPGRAMEGMGAAVSKVSGVFDELATRMMKSQNLADITKADNIMEQARTDHAAEAATLPPAERVSLWETKYRPKMEQDIQALRLSPYAADHVMPQMATFDAKTRTNISYDAYQATVKEHQDILLASINSKSAAGDFSGAKSDIDKGIDAGLWDKGKAALMTGDLVQQERQQNSDRILNQNPRWMLETTNGAIKSGKPPKELPYLQPSEVLRYNTAARALVDRENVDTFNRMRDDLVSGKITAPEQVDEQGKYLGAAERSSLKSLLLKDPAYDPETLTKLRTEIANLTIQPGDDPSTFYALSNRIVTSVPRNLQDPLLGDLKKVYDDRGKPKTARQTFMGSMMREIDTLAENGVFGQYWTGAKKPGDPQAVIDEQKKADLWAKVETYKQSVGKYILDSPDFSPDKVKDYFKGLAGADASQAAKEAFSREKPGSGQGWFSKIGFVPGGLGFPVLVGSNPDGELVNMVKGFESFSPQAYADYKQHSVGYGTRAKSPGENITEKEADSRLREELSMHAQIVDQAADSAGVKLTPNQRMALVSFDFNTGAAEYLLKSSGGDPEQIASKMLKYNKSGGVVRPGLVSRRQKEVALFNK